MIYPPAEAHLIAACPGMARIVPANPIWPAKPPRDQASPYEALVRAVVFQQLSGKAAQTILNRVIAAFPDEDFPSPASLKAAPEDRLRACGLSRQKIAAVKDIAAKRLEGVIPDGAKLRKLDDDEIVARLTAARGVGRWTVEMYLIFTLGRPDVLPIDDLGVRKGAEIALGRAFTPKALKAQGEAWAPYRSAAAWHCWRTLDAKAAAAKEAR